MKVLKRKSPIVSITLICAAVILLPQAVGDAPAQTANDKTEMTMLNIFQALARAYTYGLDSETYGDDANRQAILSSLRALATASEQLDEHGATVDPTFAYLEGSLAHDAGEALRRYQRGEYTGSRYVLTRLTHNCMTCHARVESEEDFAMGSSFLEQTSVRGLPPIERVNVEMAVRQFDKAMATYEGVFRDPKVGPVLLNMGGTFEGYLRVCMGTSSDTERARKTFEVYAQREDMPVSLKVLVDGWIESLKTIDLDAARGNELVVARELIADAQLQKRFVSDRVNLVDLVAAETLLHRYLQTNPSDKQGAAEAFYLLAIAESNVSRSYWISETPFLLERAIRLAPKSPTAPRAYEFLEEYTVSAYTGETLPDGVRGKLEELRTMVEN